MFNIPTKNNPALATLILDYMEYYGYKTVGGFNTHTHIAVDFKSRTAYRALEYNEYPIVSVDRLILYCVPERFFQVYNNMGYIQAIANRLEELEYSVPKIKPDAKINFIYTQGWHAFYTESISSERHYKSTLEDLY